MSLSLSGNKSKSKSRGTVDQTQSNTLSNRAAGILSGGIADLQGRNYQQFDPASIDQYESQYTDDVINASLGQADQADAQAFTALKSNLAGSGGFGNERRGVMEGELAGAQSRDRAQLIAGLRDKGFTDARTVAQGENANANQFQIQLQALINQLRGGFTNEGTQSLTGTTTGRNTGYGFGGGYTYGSS